MASSRRKPRKPAGARLVRIREEVRVEIEESRFSVVALALYARELLEQRRDWPPEILAHLRRAALIGHVLQRSHAAIVALCEFGACEGQLALPLTWCVVLVAMIVYLAVGLTLQALGMTQDEEPYRND